MTDDLIAEIQKFTLAARALLEREAHEQLQGIYGWLTDGSFADAKSHPALTKIEEARETRRRLERFVEDEKGIAPKEVRQRLVRETAFTWLNRIVAFRLMEERKLLKGTVGKLQRSNGFIFWLTEDNEENYRLHQQGSLPLNAMGEGPADIAYRRFLLWQSGELAREVPVLFDPDTLSSRLCPRPPVLKDLIEWMNPNTLAPAWLPGNEETIGWVYEGFIDEEHTLVFEKFSKGGKVLPEEIGAATQRFTPRWIVRFLVENSLGRLWIEMHPDSRLGDSLAYLVPVETRAQRPLKPVSEITFLDPACGSMHFGLVAFDIFEKMYREELDRAGQTGWPSKPSVASTDEIASSIIAHNLYGIDIDLRAVQIAAFALLIKARTLQPKAAFSDINLACSNIEQISGGKLDALISQAKFSHPIYERILRAIAARVKDSAEIGSLLRLEKTLEQLIAEERRKAEADKQFQIAFPGTSPEQFKTREGIEEFFGILTEQVVRHLDTLVRASREAGTDPGHFVNEAAKGLRYVRLISQRFDVVGTNPPYMSRRNMSAIMTRYLDANYPEEKSELYAAFIFRCVELTDTLGMTAMITQQSFMFISTHGPLRTHLRQTIAIQTMAHLGSKAFPTVTGEKVNTTAFVFEKQPDEQLRESQVGIYFRLINEPDADAKRRAFEVVLAAIHSGQPHALVFRYTQKDFDAIPGKPWVYWLPAGISALFKNNPTIGDSHHTCRGIQTSDNPRFIRFWWEVGIDNIRFPTSRDATLKWVPYMKGGPLLRWYGNQEHVLNWAKSGAELYAFRPKSVIRNADLMGSEGVTFSTITSGPITFRYMPSGFFWDQSGSALIRKNGKITPDLAILNSIATVALARLVAPTINYTIGDVAKLPFRPPDEQLKASTVSIIENAIKLSKDACCEVEINFDFVRPAQELEKITNRRAQLETYARQLDDAAARHYGLTVDHLAQLERDFSSILEDQGDGQPTANQHHENEESGGQTLSDEALAQSWLSYVIGTVLGRFEIGVPGGLGRGDFPAATVAEIRKLVDAEGIMVSDKGHPQDIAKRVLDCLELMLGRDAAHTTIRTATGNEGDTEDLLRDWIDEKFWKYHFQLCRKRPVYWPLQSPKRQFTVWVFHERLTKDTLFGIRKIVEERLRLLERQIADKRKEKDAGNRRAAKDLDNLLEFSDELREFSNRFQEINARGYIPHVDDGVLINAAPLHSILPSWPETRKAWQGLEKEEYDWAQQAMEYWPQRVKEKCKTNKSLAIAHGLA